MQALQIMPTSHVPPRALLLVFVLTVVWGTNWTLFPLAMREISVWTFRAFSLAGAGLILLVVGRLRGQTLSIPRRHWAIIASASVFYLLVWNLCSAYSALLIPTGQTAVLGFTMPLWSALISWTVFGERLSMRSALAVALGGTAVALLMVPGLAAYAQAPRGFALGVLGGLGWAVGTHILKRSPLEVPATVLTGWQLLLTSLPIAVGALWMGDGHWFVPSWQSIAVVTYITLVPMAIGNVCWFSIVGLLPANVAGLSAIMVPVVAMLFGAATRGEPLGPLQLAALGCCVAALSLVVLKPAQKSENL